MVYFHFNHVFNDVAIIAQLEPTPTMSIIKFITNFTLGGKMSEQGADAAGMELYQGFKFFLKTIAICGGLVLLFWQSPAFLEALAEFILALKTAK